MIRFSNGTGSKDYDGWSSDYQTTVKVEFVKEDERGGVNTYVFESSSSPKETMDPDLLAIFSPAARKNLVNTHMSVWSRQAEYSTLISRVFSP
jgi:hypothetical protein